MATATAEAEGKMSRTMTSAEGWPYRFEILPIKGMYVDESYQRPLTTFVDKIANNFDPALFGCLVCSRREDGTLAVVDGQTRLEGAKRNGVTEAPCIVYEGMTQADEAKLFAKLQKERRGMLSFHRFRASLVAGEQETVEIDRIVRECGYVVGAQANKPGMIPAVAALENAYRKGADLLERTLVILHEGWKDNHTPSGDVIRGMATFLKANPGTDDERLAQRLITVSPEELKRRASALREGAGAGGAQDKYMAGAIEGVYRRRT